MTANGSRPFITRTCSRSFSVTGDMAGRFDSPLYGMFDMVGDIDLEQHFISQPENPYDYSIKWDGEWQITYETFSRHGHGLCRRPDT